MQAKLYQQNGIATTFESLTDTDVTGALAGAILYFNGSEWEDLAPGTSGAFLVSNGAAAPSWSASDPLFSGDNISELVNDLGYITSPFDASAIHINVSNEYIGAALASDVASTDRLLIEDASDSFNKKYTTVNNFVNYLIGEDFTWTGEHIFDGDVIFQGATPDFELGANFTDGTVDFSGATVTGLSIPGGDTDAIHDNIAGEINAITVKTTPVSGDLILIEDSADTFNKRKLQ